MACCPYGLGLPPPRGLRRCAPGRVPESRWRRRGARQLAAAAAGWRPRERGAGRGTAHGPGWTPRARNQVSAGLPPPSCARGSLPARWAKEDVFLTRREALWGRARARAAGGGACGSPSRRAGSQAPLDSCSPVFSPPPRPQLRSKAPCRLRGAWHVCARGWGLANAGGCALAGPGSQEARVASRELSPGRAWEFCGLTRRKGAEGKRVQLCGSVCLHLEALASQLLRHTAGPASSPRRRPQAGLRPLRGLLYS